jgi:5-methylcytosine-specific restriction endonuclease McrA
MQVWFRNISKLSGFGLEWGGAVNSSLLAFSRRTISMNKEEQRVYNRNYRIKNIDRLKAKAKAYSSRHKKSKKKYDAKRYASNTKEIRERSKNWKLKHPEEAKRNAALWYQRNKEKLKAKAALYYEENKEKCKASMSAYSKAHPEADKAKHAKRATEKTNNGGSFTVQEWLALCKKYKQKCLRCRERKPLAADHVVPVSKGGTSNIDNIQPLCKVCNSVKHTKSTDYRMVFKERTHAR